MKHLYAMDVSEPICIKCYESFIESVLRFHLPTIFGHLLAESKSKIDRCIKCAAKLSKVKLDSISDVYNTAFATRCLRLVATDNDNPFMEFDHLPSGRLRAVKCRVNLRKDCFRSRCVSFYNSLMY